jgi:hypothetical protein
MGSGRVHPRRRIVEYDGLQHRVWILGQRCHHGATGSLVTAVACIGLIAELAKPSMSARAMLALAATGGALMAHDWKDHAIWFERGHGSQS